MNKIFKLKIPLFAAGKYLNIFDISSIQIFLLGLIGEYVGIVLCIIKTLLINLGLMTFQITNFIGKIWHFSLFTLKLCPAHLLMKR